MFLLDAEKNRLTVREKETLTSGSVNVCPVRFEFSADWEDLDRTAVFRAGAECRAAAMAKGSETVIPWEVLEKPGVRLFCGVYGTRDGSTVLPTVWADLGTVLEGAVLGETARPPAPELWRQELALCRDHRWLSHRDAENQHPIEAIDGLSAELERIPAPVEALTNYELEEILK